MSVRQRQRNEREGEREGEEEVQIKLWNLNVIKRLSSVPTV